MAKARLDQHELIFVDDVYIPNFPLEYIRYSVELSPFNLQLSIILNKVAAVFAPLSLPSFVPLGRSFDSCLKNTHSRLETRRLIHQIYVSHGHYNINYGTAGPGLERCCLGSSLATTPFVPLSEYLLIRT